MDSKALLERTSLLRGLDDEAIHMVLAAACPREVFFRKGEIVAEQEREMRNIPVVAHGHLGYRRYHSGGLDHLLRQYSEGEIVALEALVAAKHTLPANVFAYEDGSYVAYDYAAVFEGGGLPTGIRNVLLRNALRMVANESIRFMKKTAILSPATTREKILFFLINKREHGGGLNLDIGMTQNQFAQYLGVNRSVLSAELNRMRKDGLIDFSGSVYQLM
jgi:CRP-like cAMP-binding protein